MQHPGKKKRATLARWIIWRFHPTEQCRSEHDSSGDETTQYLNLVSSWMRS
jgi:hypothetical protein